MESQNFHHYNHIMCTIVPKPIKFSPHKHLTPQISRVHTIAQLTRFKPPHFTAHITFITSAYTCKQEPNYGFCTPTHTVRLKVTTHGESLYMYVHCSQVTDMYIVHFCSCNQYGQEYKYSLVPRPRPKKKGKGSGDWRVFAGFGQLWVRAPTSPALKQISNLIG